MIFIISIILIFLMLFSGEVHNDFYRYLYDGYVASQGVSPYTVTPDLFPVDAWYWNKLDFKHFHTIYGPVPEAMFTLAALIKSHSLLALKIVMAFFAIGNVLVLKVLTQNKKDERKLLPWVLFLPIFFFDGVAAAHTEIILAFFLLWSIYLYRKRVFGWLGVTLAAMVMTKFYPLLIIPFFISKKRTALVFVMSMIFLSLPLLLDSGWINLLSSLERFAELWVMAPGAYVVLEMIFGNFAQLASLLLLLAFIGWLWRRKTEALTASFFSLSLYIFLSKTIFSWYWLPILVLFPMVKSSFKWPILWTIIVFHLQYFLTKDGGVTFVYTEPLWFALLAWIPPFLIAAFILLKRQKNSTAVVFYSKYHHGQKQMKTRLEKGDWGNKFGGFLVQTALAKYLPQKSDGYDFFWFASSSYDGTYFEGKERVTGFISGVFKNVGEGMHSLQRGMIRRGYKKVLIVGSDIPGIEKITLLQTIKKLDDYDVVMVPVEDGGYGLIATKGYVDIFSGIKNFNSRSQGYQLAQKTQDLVAQKHKSLYKFPLHYDIDYWQDVQRFYREKHPLISIVIPARNEAVNIKEILENLEAIPDHFEVIISDANSTDNTTEVVKSFKSSYFINLLKSEKATRAGAMNMGAGQARGKYLLFLHADARLDNDAFFKIRLALASKNIIGGAFKLRLDSSSLKYRFIELFSNTRARLFEMYHGDQAMFIKKSEFEGFEDIALMEDVALSLYMRKRGGTVLLDAQVSVSPRRFEKSGIIKMTFLYFYLKSLYYLGYSTDKLAKIYYPPN